MNEQTTNKRRENEIRTVGAILRVLEDLKADAYQAKDDETGDACGLLAHTICSLGLNDDDRRELCDLIAEHARAIRSLELYMLERAGKDGERDLVLETLRDAVYSRFAFLADFLRLSSGRYNRTQARLLRLILIEFNDAFRVLV